METKTYITLSRLAALLLFLSCGISLPAQTVNYTYDNAGNRTGRTVSPATNAAPSPVAFSVDTALLRQAASARQPAQTVSLSKSHNESPYPPLIVLDGLEITREEIEEWGIEKKVIKRIKLDLESEECSRGYCGIIRLYSKMLISLDGSLLVNSKEKEDSLSKIKREDISLIKMIDKQEAVRQYGKKGKYGALLIQTENPCRGRTRGTTCSAQIGTGCGGPSLH